MVLWWASAISGATSSHAQQKRAAALLVQLPS
jgi:hypothetical protein